MTIDEDLVRALVREQFPRWADLPVRQVLPGGWDNRTFRLGEDLAVRLPSAEGYAAAVEKEQRWLPALAPQLPLPIPEPVGHGTPTAEYPWAWSVNRPAAPSGSPRGRGRTAAGPGCSAARACHRATSADVTGGPIAGPHSFFRGGDLAVYEAEARAVIDDLPDRDLARWAGVVLDRALTTSWESDPVWVHGDVADGNLLVAGGRLSAVIDFGSSAIGDPSCDLVIVWTSFDRATAAVFQEAVGLDDATWQRAAGWALWKALITLDAPGSRRTIDRLREDLPG
jgi:aminoglycoside phosphotransferase (APT) family kinase protein